MIISLHRRVRDTNSRYQQQPSPEKKSKFYFTQKLLNCRQNSAHFVRNKIYSLNTDLSIIFAFKQAQRFVVCPHIHKCASNAAKHLLAALWTQNESFICHLLRAGRKRENNSAFKFVGIKIVSNDFIIIVDMQPFRCTADITFFGANRIDCSILWMLMLKPGSDTMRCQPFPDVYSLPFRFGATN